MSGREAPAPIAQTLDRGLQILEAVAHTGDSLTVAEAATAVGLDRTVVHRLVATLAARGYLQRASTGGYRLGPTCLALASVVTDLRATARPHLEALREATGETVHLVVLSGRDVVFVDSVESIHALRVASRTGRLLPAHATSVGKALLAALPPDRFQALYGHADLVAVTKRTISDPHALERDLAATRERGYATSRGESENGVGSVGVAVCNAAGEPRAALSVAMPLDRLTDAVEQQAVAALRSSAAELGAQL
ncbi:IclR family transcriptional regulator [Streptomyces sp. NPDC097610]|uniref:IclR family transcriptional regulator n=1 Tax=Streptomyces sp. NPDC097610 TaxID=3157227 RepID=UPI00332D74B4